MTSRAWLAAAAAAVLAVVGLADLNVPDISWQGRSLAPWHRATSLALVWVAAAAIGFAVVIKRGRKLPASLIPFAAFLGWLLVGSITGIHPQRSVFVWLGYTSLAVLCVAAALLRQRLPVVGIAVGATAITYASLVVDRTGWVERDDWFDRLSGLTLEPNIMATIAGLSVVSIAALVVEKRRLLPVGLLLAAPGLAAVWLSDTRTVLGALAVAAGAMAWNAVPRATLSAVALAGLLIVSFVDVGELTEPARRTEGEQLSDLSGRTGIWESSLDWIAEEPFTGAGLASGPGQFLPRSQSAGASFSSYSSHNLPIEIARESGVIGLGLAVWAVAAARPWRVRWLRPLFAYLLVAAATMPTSGLPGLTVAAWFVLIAVGALSSPGVHSTALGVGRQDSVGSNRGTNGLRLPLHQP